MKLANATGFKLTFMIFELLQVLGDRCSTTKLAAITIPRLGFRLNGKVIDEHRSVSMITCKLKCLHHSKCLSTNVLRHSRSFFVDICQLISDNLESRAGGLTTNPRWIYTEVKVGDYRYFMMIKIRLTFTLPEKTIN